MTLFSYKNWLQTIAFLLMIRKKLSTWVIEYPSQINLIAFGHNLYTKFDLMDGVKFIYQNSFHP
jgi:hypothetical protein